MATYKLNIARIRNCPPPQKVLAAMESFGLPEREEFGVLNCSSNQRSIFATIIRKTQQAVQRLDAETHEVLSAAVEKVHVYPFGVRPDAEVLEVYAGPAGAIEQVGLFLASCLALPVVVEPIELDIPSAIGKLAKREHFQLRSLRVSEYAHNSYMSGPYAPRFLDSEHGREFLDEYADFVKAAGVRFQGPTGRVSVTLRLTATFSFSCAEDDLPTVQATLRKLI